MKLRSEERKSREVNEIMWATKTKIE